MSRPNSASSEHRSALPEGTRLHNYTLERVLGAGGFGITYMAREEVTERAVAIKEYLPSSLAVRERDGMTVQPVSESSRPDYEWGLTRFRQEARLLLGLRHPNIVPSLNYFEANGTAYLVMEYQEGQTLSQLTAGAVALEESEVREFIEPLLDGVEAVHRAGLLHRDIKPDNIFIRRDGTPVLIDFGSARQALGHHSQSLTAVVTDGYAPFEQYERGGDQGPWTDIYALGAVLFRCLVGHRPPTSTKRLSAQYRGAPDPAAQGFAALHQRCSRAAARAIEAALAVNAEDRPQSIADLRALLADTGARAAAGRPDAASPTLLAGTTAAPAAGTFRTGGTYRAAGGPPRRRRALPVYAGIVALLLAGGAGAAYLGVGGLSIPGITLSSTSEEAKKRADDEAKRKAEDEARLKAEEEARRKAEDDKRRAAEDAKRRADEDAKRRADDEAKRRAEDEKRRADEAAKRKAEEERARREDARRAEEESKRRADAEARRKAEDEAKRRADADARRKAEEDARRRAEDEAKRKAEEDRIKAAMAARPSWYAAERNRGAVFFAHKSALIEPSAAAALERLVADARASANYRITLVAVAERNEGTGAAAARLRAARLDAVRVWLVARGVPSERIRVLQQANQAEGAEHRYVAIALEGQPAAAEPPARPAPGDRPGAARPATPDSSPRYSRGELTRIMHRLIKGAALSTAIKFEGDTPLPSGIDPSALAVCVNWQASTPERAVIGGAYQWTRRISVALGERAVEGCRAMGRPNCDCVLLEDNGAPALVLPPSFVQRYAR